MVWRRRTGDCHGESAAVRSYIGTSTLAFASWLVGLLFDVGRPKRFGTTPPPSHNDHTVHYRCSATATNDVTTAATMMTTKLPRGMFTSILASLEGQDLEGFWSKNGGSGITIFIVRCDFRAWEVAKSVGVSAEKCEAAKTHAPGITIFVVRERFRGVEFRKIDSDLYEKCSTALILRHTYRTSCYL